MNRRGFFGLGAGAVLGGPKLAQEFVQQGGVAFDYPQSASGMASSAKQAFAGDWRLERIAELKRKISGEEESGHARWRRDAAIDQRDRYRLDALRSVSLQHKGHMLAEADIRRERERERRSWLAELFKLESGEGI